MTCLLFYLNYGIRKLKSTNFKYQELTAIDWGVDCLACRTMMRIGIDGKKYPTG
ncbi:MAG: hypothetical protein ACFFEN_04100 [Candidatus Thorarchaeota archaeon]